MNATYQRPDAKYDSYNFFVAGFVGRCHDAVTLTNCSGTGTVSVFWKKHSDVDYSVVGAKTPTNLNSVDSLIGHKAKTPSETGTKNQITVNKQVLEAGN